MTDDEAFMVVLEELWRLRLDFADLRDGVVLIGGHVVALHARIATGSAAIQTTTENGVTITRGYTHEPDLLFEVEGDEFSLERIPEALRARGYKPVRTYRWARQLEALRVEFDLFQPIDGALPVPATTLPDASAALRRTLELKIELGGQQTVWRVPDAFGFMTLKVQAKLVHRPNSTKDCFDLFTYVQVRGTRQVATELDSAPDRASHLRRQLRVLFWSAGAPGVLDVVAEAGQTNQVEQALLAQAVVDLFAELE